MRWTLDESDNTQRSTDYVITAAKRGRRRNRAADTRPLPPLRKWRLIHSGYALTIPGRCTLRHVGGAGDPTGGAEKMTDKLARRAG